MGCHEGAYDFDRQSESVMLVVMSSYRFFGFINPALYANPWLLNDVTNGTNPGCGTSGFSSTPGWDPVTGLGTPNFPRLLEFFSLLP